MGKELSDEVRVLIREEVAKSGSSGESHAAHIMSCPGCFSSVVKELAKSDFKCGDCDTPLGSREMVKALDDCPLCGSQNPVEIEGGV